MNAGTLTNCVHCGKIFIKGLRDICPNCQREWEQDLLDVRKFLRENVGSTIEEVHESTGVAKTRIVDFIIEGHVVIYDNPHIFYACSRCGDPIREGKMCKNCLNEIQAEVAEMEQSVKSKKSVHGYYNKL